MAQPTNSNVDELQQNSSLIETYKNQLSDYCRKHSEKHQKFKKEELKKESQINARKQNKEAESKLRSVRERFERGKRVVEEVSDRTCIHANPKRGIEACADVGNIHLSHEISSQGLRNSFRKLTKGLHRFNPAQKDQKSQTEEVMGITSCHFPWLEEAAQLWPFALLTNSVDDVKKLKRAKEAKDRKEYVFDLKKEWTGVTA